MSKAITEVLTSIKGQGNELKTLTGKKIFSQALFGKFVKALANDPEYKVVSVGKDGTSKIETNIRELLVDDVKKTIANAKYPQKSELDVLNSSEIATDGLSKAYSLMASEWLKTGKKLPIAPQENFTGEIYLVPVKGKTRTVNVRDIKSKENIGTTTITTKDSIQVRVKSPVPKHLVTKVRNNAKG